jgi:hypothetical protein
VKLEHPRPLESSEASILDMLLAPDFPGAVELRAQIPDCRVVGRCDCGCPAVNLQVVGSATVRSLVNTRQRRAPCEGVVIGEDGKEVADIMVFVADGYLSGLEYVPYGKPTSRAWPSIESVRLIGPLG